jgi:hypothetical protein
MVEIRSISVRGQSGKKVSKIPPQQINLGVVVHLCDPSYSGDIAERTQSKAAPGKNERLYLKNN